MTGKMYYICKALILCLCLNFISGDPNAQRVISAFTKPSYRNDQYLAELFRVIKTGNIRKVQEMLGNWNINVANEDLITALHVAAVKGNDEMANLLIQHGANVNLQSSTGQSALHVAANNGNLKFGEVLIKTGAAIDAVDQEGVTPLQLAVFNDDEQFVELLIKSGADVNHVDNKGGSVMHWAAHKASDKLANTLIKNGAKNVSVQDHTGKTPLYYAKLTGNSKFEKALIKFLASGNAVKPQLNVELLLLAFGLYFMSF